VFNLNKKTNLFFRGVFVFLFKISFNLNIKWYKISFEGKIATIQGLYGKFFLTLTKLQSLVNLDLF
jgi:hypothetical protein